MAALNTGHAQMTGEIVVPCFGTDELRRTLEFFTNDPLHFRVVQIYPADDPTIAVIVGHGLRLRLAATTTIRPRSRVEPCRLRLLDHGGHNLRRASLTAPNGTVIDFAPLLPVLLKPPLRASLVVTTVASAPFHEGRASMLYV